MRDWTLVLPLLAEQSALANYLDAETAHIDSLVDAKRRLVDLLRDRENSLVDALVSSRSGSALRPDVPWLSRVPAGWPSVALGHLAAVFNGSTPAPDDESGGIPWTTSGDIDQRLITHPTRYITRETARSHGLRIAPAGSVVVGLIGQGRTRGLTATLAFPSTLNQNIAAIVPRDSRLDPRYLDLLLQLAYDDLRNSGRGGNQAALNCEMLATYHIPLAPRAAQLELVERVVQERARDGGLAVRLRRSIELLLERRQALITAAVTGELTIPGVAA